LALTRDFRLASAGGHRLGLGIVEKVFPADTFRNHVKAWPAKLASGPTMAQGYIKLSQGLEASLAEGLTLERAHQNLLFGSADATEGVAAFLEKRPARFTGK
jgi:enoyl-CoA hydratase/carnithine racemase